MKIVRALGMMPILAVLGVTSSPTAFADDAGWYAGFNGGQSRAKIADGRIADGLLGDGFTTTSISNEDHHLGFKLFGGYEFNRYFALEGGYFDLGRFGFT
ncbi:MAG: OmpA-OmpF porin, family, partial [Gammaproteobacteria bacterium]|nr:OmpA-OmpF porin, family [Gammaproteobacteria bacterium]